MFSSVLRSVADRPSGPGRGATGSKGLLANEVFVAALFLILHISVARFISSLNIEK